MMTRSMYVMTTSMVMLVTMVMLYTMVMLATLAMLSGCGSSGCLYETMSRGYALCPPLYQVHGVLQHGRNYLKTFLTLVTNNARVSVVINITVYNNGLINRTYVRNRYNLSPR